MFTVKELLKAVKGKLIYGSDNAGIAGISIDSRTIKPKEAFIALKGDNFDGHDFIDQAIKEGAGALIIQSRSKLHSPGVKQPVILVKNTIKALGDIARFQRERFDIPVIAVTGSNGKTTTKEMISDVLCLKYNVLKNAGTKNNQIGMPLTLANLDSNHDIAVLEIGTNHFGEVEYLANICRPNIAVITNVGPSHLEYFHNLKGVFKEKAALMKHLSSPFISILNSDDNLLKKITAGKTKRPFAIAFGIENECDFRATGLETADGRIEFMVNEKFKYTLNSIGCCSIYNALTAIAVARIFGLEHEEIALRLSNFNFPKSRMNLVEVNNIKFIDDTYNSNPNSLRVALESFDKVSAAGRKIFVMGDMKELGKAEESFHREAGLKASQVCDVFITVGELSKIAGQIAQNNGFDAKNIFTCNSAQEARDILLKKVSPVSGDIVLVKGSRSMKMEEVLKTSK